MEKQPHNNPWADKLLQVSMPDSGESWMHMEAILDKKMPRHFSGDKRRWFVLVLLLLLLIGVCNCPGHGRLFRSSTLVPPLATPTTNGRSLAAKPGAPLAIRNPDWSRVIIKSPIVYKSPVVDGSWIGHGSGGAHRSHTTQRSSAAHRSQATGRGTNDRPPSAAGGESQPEDPTPKQPDTPATTKPDSAGSSKTGTPLTAKPSPRKDSSQKKKPAPPPQDKKEKEKDHGWVFGAGFNQFFPIGGARGSVYNSNGLTGTLSDYLPVPMIRYYFNHRTYIQLEAQLNTPQPTKKNLVISSPPQDTSLQGGVLTQVQSSATIQQLYYFNILLSLHFSPIENLNVGTGLQFSHLSNAIGEFDTSITTIPVNGNGSTGNGNTTSNTGPTTSKSIATRSFKDDPLFHRIKTNEFRLLLDVNYSYRHFVLGLRYNQALSNFVNIQLPTGSTTQARNSSLQLYLRYILWDTRKRKTASAAK